MLDVTGHKIDLLPIPELKRFYDLVYVDGVILTHLIDPDGRNFFQYLVDFADEKSRWLIWKVSDELLYKYVFGRVSLLGVLIDPSKDYIFSFDADVNGSKTNIMAFEVKDIPDDYLPDENSIIQFIKVPEEYDALFESVKEGFYIEKLRESAIDFKVSAEDPRYASTIGISSVSDFLSKLQTSYLNYSKIDFFKSFGDTTSDYKRLNSAYSDLKPNLDLRILEVRYGSFEVTLSADTVLAKGAQQYRDWQYKVLEKYKDDVIELDYDSEDSVQEIIDKYSDDERRSIYSPYIQIISSKKYRVNVVDNSSDFRKVYKAVKQDIKDRIVPKPKLLPPDEKEKILRIAVFEAEEDKEFIDISKTELRNNLFFTEPAVEEVRCHLDKIEANTATIFLKKKIACLLSKSDKGYKLTNQEFDITYEVRSKDDLYRGFFNKFLEFYQNLMKSSSESDIEMRNRLNEYISRVEETKD